MVSVESIVRLLADRSPSAVSLFLPKECLDTALQTPTIRIFANNDEKAAKQAAKDLRTEVWVFGATSKVAFALYNQTTMGDRLRVWDLVRSDNGFWSDPAHAGSLPCGPLYWPWLFGRIKEVTLYLPDRVQPWTRKGKRLHNNVLVCFAISSTAGLGSFRARSVRVETDATTAGPASASPTSWSLGPSDAASTSLPDNRTYDFVMLCEAGGISHVRAKSGWNCRARKWGPDGFLRARVSGIPSDTCDELLDDAAAYWRVGESFEAGVMFNASAEEWAALLPRIRDSAWKARVAHESHNCVCIGGDPSAIVRDLSAWLPGLSYRTWRSVDGVITTSTGTTGSASAVSAPKYVTVRDIDPLFTDYDAQLLLVAAGVVFSHIRFADDGPHSNACHLIVEVSNQSDVDKLCRIPIDWNGKFNLHFKPSTSDSERSIRTAPTNHAKGSKRNLDAAAESASNALARLSLEERAPDVHPDLPASDVDAAAEPPHDDAASTSRTEWTADSWVLAPPLQDGGDAEYLQLTCRRDDGSWEARCAMPEVPTVAPTAGPNDARGPSYVVDMPEDRPKDKLKTKRHTFFYHRYGGDAKARTAATIAAKTANAVLSEWHANRSRVLLVAAADHPMTGESTSLPLYSLSQARYIGGEGPDVFAITRGPPGKLGRLDADHRRRDIQKAATRTRKETEAEETPPPGDPGHDDE